MSVNRVVISGNLTRDPVLRQTAGGLAVLNFSVAINDRKRNSATGEWEKHTNFVDCIMFGQRAQAVLSFLSKGTKVFVDGRLRYSSWEKDGQKRSKLEVAVDDIDIANSSKAEASSAAAPSQQVPAVQDQQPAPAIFSPDDPDIAF